MDMKKWFVCLFAAVMLAVATSGFAGCGSCSGDVPAPKVKGDAMACAVSLEKLNLTADQKAKVAALQEECKDVKCPVACRAKMAEGLKGILTDEQFKQWEKACADAKKSGACPLSKDKKE